MGKIVDDRHAADRPANLDTTLDRLKGTKRLLNFLSRNAPRIGRDDDGKAIADVELAYQMRFEFTPFFTVAKDRKFRHVACKINVTGLPFCVVRKAKGLDICKQLAVHFV